jgi:iron(III) transport system permease protein
MWSVVTLSNYTSVLHDPTTARAAKNSIILAAGAATSVMLVTAIIAWLVIRTRLPGRWIIDNLTLLPLAIPGLVLGIALMFVYVRSSLPIYGTLWILLIAYFTINMPYGMRYASTSMFQIGRELEESAAMSGAGWLATFRRVVLPLLVPGFVAGWIYILIVSVRELGSSVLLYSPGREVLSIVVWEYYRDGNLPYVGALGILMIGTLVVLVGIAYKLGARIGVREG